MRRSAAALRVESLQCAPYQSNGRWLDIGCSAGFILNATKQAGYEPYGVDLDRSGLAHARETFGIENLYEGPLEQHRFESGFFDVISLYDVIAHVLDLHSLVAELKCILVPGGTLEIWTPDVRDWRRKCQLEAWKAVMPYKHLYYFDRTTLTRLLKAHSLRVIKRPFAWKLDLRMYVRHEP